MSNSDIFWKAFISRVILLILAIVFLFVGVGFNGNAKTQLKYAERCEEIIAESSEAYNTNDSLAGYIGWSDVLESEEKRLRSKIDDYSKMAEERKEKAEHYKTMSYFMYVGFGVFLVIFIVEVQKRKEKLSEEQLKIDENNKATKTGDC